MEQLNLLIGKSDIEPYAHVSMNLKDEKYLAPSILQAQNLDIKPVFGNVFWTDLLINVNDDNYQSLLNGGEYSKDGKTYMFQGLKAAIACFTYARYVYSRNIVDTPFGMVQKNSDYSTPADTKALTQIGSFARNSGEQYLQESLKYVKDNIALFPVFADNCGTKATSKGSSKITPASRF